MDKDALSDSITELQNAYVHAMALLEVIDGALDGKEPSDFWKSFSIVRRVWDLYREKSDG